MPTFSHNRVPSTDSTSPIIVPLDTDDLGAARKLVRDLAGHVGAFKVGYELGYHAGWQTACGMVREEGGELMVDLKLDDIPNTVGGAARAFQQFTPKFLTVHATSGANSIRAAVENSLPTTTVLAVTVLTSIDDEESKMLFGDTAEAAVVRFAAHAFAAGATGVVCSPKELHALHNLQPEYARVTPGVRPDWAAANDQARVMTPADAMAAGATHLVIGRPITKPPAEIGSPVDAVIAIHRELGIG